MWRRIRMKHLDVQELLALQWRPVLYSTDVHVNGKFFHEKRSDSWRTRVDHSFLVQELCNVYNQIVYTRYERCIYILRCLSTLIWTLHFGCLEGMTDRERRYEHWMIWGSFPGINRQATHAKVILRLVRRIRTDLTTKKQMRVQGKVALIRMTADALTEHGTCQLLSLYITAVPPTCQRHDINIYNIYFSASSLYR